MDKEEAQAIVRGIDDDHRNDRDGGYMLVHAITWAGERLTPEERDVFSEGLADFVRAEEYPVWAVALSALVDLRAERQVGALAEEIAAHEGVWQDEVLFAVARLGLRAYREVVLQHLQAPGPERNLTLPIMAAFCRIDPDACLEIASTFFAGERGLVSEAAVAAFMRNFLEIDEGLIARLVRAVSARRGGAGQRVARWCDDYLAKPWMDREFGAERMKRLRKEVMAVVTP